MGNKWRQRNYQPNETFNADITYRNDNYWHERQDFCQTRHGRYPVKKCEQNTRARDPYLPYNPGRYHNPFQNHSLPRIRNQSQNYTRPRPSSDPFPSQSPTTNPARDEFDEKSKAFKAYIVDTVWQILLQIQQWYPDENSPSHDGMDWQPEVELIIPQPAADVHYVWDTAKPSHLSPPSTPSFNGMRSETTATGNRKTAARVQFVSCSSDEDETW